MWVRGAYAWRLPADRRIGHTMWRLVYLWPYFYSDNPVAIYRTKWETGGRSSSRPCLNVKTCDLPVTCWILSFVVFGPGWSLENFVYVLWQLCLRVGPYTFNISAKVFTLLILLSLGKNCESNDGTQRNVPVPTNDALVDPEWKLQIPIPTLSLESYGTIHCGYETMTSAWPTLHHVFLVSSHTGSKADHVHPGICPPWSLLVEHPVNLLVIDSGNSSPGSSPCTDFWYKLIHFTPTASRPQLVLEIYSCDTV